MLEVACPESCEYLAAGRKREVEEYKQRLQKMDSSKQEKYRITISQHHDVITHLEYAISRERLQSRNLKDKDAAQAIDLLLDAYRTEDKGILYEKKSDDIRIESLRMELRKVVESFRNPEGAEKQGVVDPQNTRLQLGGAIECLEFIQTLIAMYVENRTSLSGYVDFLARVIPRSESKSSIVLP